MSEASLREADELRHEMARIDARLVEILDERARVARRLGELRGDHAPTLPVGDHAAIRELVERSSGDMPRETLREVLREVFAAGLLDRAAREGGVRRTRGRSRSRGGSRPLRIGSLEPRLGRERKGGARRSVAKARGVRGRTLRDFDRGPSAVDDPRLDGQRPPHLRGARRRLRSSRDEPDRNALGNREDLRHAHRPRAVPSVSRRDRATRGRRPGQKPPHGMPARGRRADRGGAGHGGIRRAPWARHRAAGGPQRRQLARPPRGDGPATVRPYRKRSDVVRIQRPGRTRIAARRAPRLRRAGHSFDEDSRAIQPRARAGATSSTSRPQATSPTEPL